jgi:hypothetical protein
MGEHGARRRAAGCRVPHWQNWLQSDADQHCGAGRHGRVTRRAEELGYVDELLDRPDGDLAVLSCVGAPQRDVTIGALLFLPITRNASTFTNGIVGILGNVVVFGTCRYVKVAKNAKVSTGGVLATCLRKPP